MPQVKKFPYAEEVTLPPELEGWEEMYAPQRRFSADRGDWEKRHFWYQDKIHAPEPLYPLDDIFQSSWQIALSQFTTRVFCIPPAQGVAQRILGCYMYIAAVEPPPADVIQEKAALFGKRVPYVFENYNMLWDKWYEKFRALGNEMKELKVPAELHKYVPDDQVFPAPRGYTQAFEAHRIVQQHNKHDHQGLAVAFRVPQPCLSRLPHVCRYIEEAVPQHKGEYHRQDGGRRGSLHVPAGRGAVQAQQARRRPASRRRYPGEGGQRRGEDEGAGRHRGREGLARRGSTG